MVSCILGELSSAMLFERKVLVTGATGFIRWHLCEALVALGAEVHGLSRSACAENLVCGCRGWTVSMEEIQGVRGVVSKIQPQLIYYLAGMVTARQNLNLVLPILRNNLVGSVQVLLAATEKGCCLVGTLLVSVIPNVGISGWWVI